MKHATDNALDTLEPLLQRLRALAGLTEKKRGVFYRGSLAFLHFHEDAAGFFADVRIGSDWQRFAASARRDQQALVAVIRGELGASTRTSRLKTTGMESLPPARMRRR